MTQVYYAKSYSYVSNPPGYAPLPTQHAWLEVEVYHQSKSWGSSRWWTPAPMI
jgi:hypothetical protein